MLRGKRKKYRRGREMGREREKEKDKMNGKERKKNSTGKSKHI